MSTREDLRTISQSYNETESLVQSLARTDINIAIEYFGKDQKGQRIVQAAIHREIQWHIDECKKQHFQNCGILAPWGHGKTEQAAIFRLLDEIGKDRNIRAQLICNTDENSTARVGTVSRYIKEDKDYHEIYPDIFPSKSEDWGKHKLVVDRDSKSKDGTLEAWGVTTSGTGSRADLQIFDDPVDLRNAILNPALRQQVKESFRNVWLSRLMPNGFRIYIATIWHEDDLTSELIKSAEWKFLIMKVSEDFKSIKCSSPFKGDYEIPLWDIWGEEKLKAQFRLLRERAFNRGYRQKAMSDEDRTFPSCEKIFRWDVGQDVIRPDWPRVIGMDPFGKKVVIFTLAYNPQNFMRFPVEILIGRWRPKESISHFLDAYRRHAAQLAIVENNAAQDAITQWAQEVGGRNIIIVPFVTGVQKASPEIGLRSLEVEFANNSWVVPMRGIDEADNENSFIVWKNELYSHPVGEAEDTVMAMWFAREGVRFLTQNDLPKEDNQIFNQEQILNVEPVRIGEY